MIPVTTAKVLPSTIRPSFPIRTRTNATKRNNEQNQAGIPSKLCFPQSYTQTNTHAKEMVSETENF